MRIMRKKSDIIMALAAMLAVASCSYRAPENPFFDSASSPAMPCLVSSDTTLLIVRDYFPKIERVDNVTSDDYTIIPVSKDDMDTVLVVATPASRTVSVLTVTTGDESGSIVLKTKTPEMSGSPVVATVDVDMGGRQFTVKGENAPAGYIVLWQNTVLDHKFMSYRKSGEFTVHVPENAEDMERSYIRIYSYSQHGAGSDILVPLCKGRVIDDVDMLERTDRQTWVMYQIMIDRFFNGDESNDWRMNRPDVLPKADYFGGDLAGIDLKLEEGYFDTLGINTVWISPITQNPYTAWGLNKDPYTRFSGYHGYWPVYMTKLDPRYGTPEELHHLIDDVHAGDKNIILDYVANHLHVESPLLQAHPDWKTPEFTPDGRPNLELWDEFRLTTWFDKHIPTLDLEREDVNEPMTDSALVWMKEYEFDGFRHDATKHIPEVYWRKLTRKLLEEVPDRSVFQIGETYGSPELISSYVRTGMLDCQFDFNIYDTYIAATSSPEGSFATLAGTIDGSLHTYGYHNLMGVISGNHDRARYVSIVGGDLIPGEDYKAAGWKRNIGVSDTLAYRKLMLLHAMNMTLPGIPVIYTGDEWGQPGGNDPDNRRWSQFEPRNAHEAEVFRTVCSLVHERTSSMPLLYGDYYLLAADQDYLAYIRVYMGDYVVVALNKSDEPVRKVFDLPFGLRYQGSPSIAVETAPLSFSIVNSK